MMSDNSRFHTLEIRLFPRAADGYPVELRYDLFEASGHCQIDGAALLALAADPELYGRRLGEQLFGAEGIAAGYAQIQAAAERAGELMRVRLRLPALQAAPELQRIWWERLYHPARPTWQPLASTPDVPFSRYLSAGRLTPYRPYTRRDLKALAVVASPAQLGGYPLWPIPDEDRQALIESLRAPGCFDVTLLASGSDALPTRQRLRQELARGYHVVHFLCHGALVDDQTYLYLEDEAGQADPVSAEKMLEIFHLLAEPPALAVLMACETAQAGAGATSFTLLGPALIEGGRVEAVVSMSTSVSMHTARRFTDQFYRQLARHGIIDRAMNEARAYSQDAWDWSVPVLLMRSDDGRLFVEPEILAAPDEALEKIPPEAGQPPYLGLAAFSEADADRFFGREELALAITRQLQAGSFLGLLGPSGSGKSSLLYAGVIPALRRSGWRIATLTPTNRPLHALAHCLSQAGWIGGAVDEHARRLADEPAGLLSAWLATMERSLLAVDQFEELFTLCANPDERRAFVRALLELADAGRLTFMALLRDDYAPRTAEIPGLREALARRQAFVGDLSEPQLIQVMLEPARRGAWRFVEGLVETILDDVRGQPGALPLLSHALRETWERRRGRVLTLSGYQASGGVGQAIAQSAESVYLSLPPAQRDVARDLFLRLTAVEESALETRRRLSPDELTGAEVSGAVLERLAQARLVTLSAEAIEFSHEAIIRQWPTLQQWLAQDRHCLSVHQRLADEARAWETRGRDDGVLYRGARLAEALTCLPSSLLHFTPLEQAFLAASQAAEAAALRRARRLRRAALGSGVLLICLLGVIIVYQPVKNALLKRQARPLNPPVFLEAGLAWLGLADAAADRAYPRRQVDLPAYLIQRYEVSNQEYDLCVSAGACAPLAVAAQDSELPVNVNAFQAVAYCTWLGGALPTEAQWERAARGLEGRLWPWGDAPQPSTRYVNMSIQQARPGPVAASGARFQEGATPEGIMHLVGNVAEWTQTPAQCQATAYCATTWDGQSWLATRGGSYADTLEFGLPNITQATFRSPDLASLEVGFRCVFAAP